jgi:peptidyl-tRNA hydrolase
MVMSSVQYIVVRKDLVPVMGIGKTAAQVAHASLGVLLTKEEKTRYDRLPTGTPVRFAEEITRLIHGKDVDAWFRGKFTKLVVYVKTKQKLLNLAKKLDNDNIRHKLIYDACHTMLEPEEENGTTLTCMGVIPISRDNIPKYLQKLRLLE